MLCSEMKIILCDLDGTLCDHTHRIHHAWCGDYKSYFAAIEHDGVNRDVFNFITINRNNKIIFLTGRPEKCRDVTEKWIRDNIVIDDYELIMRADDDFRKAPIFKREQVEKIIDTFGLKKIFRAIDDDMSCCDMYEMLGIKTLRYIR